jgi:hypothetical protein
LFELDASAAQADAAACITCDPAQLQLEAGSSTPHEGGDSGTEHDDLCPAPQVLIGYTGSLREVSTTDPVFETITLLDGLCGSLQLGPQGSIGVIAASPLPSRGEASGSYGAWSQRCPADQVLVGAEGRAGIALDQLALICATPQVDAQGALQLTQESTLPAAGGDGGTPFMLRCPEGQVAWGQHLRSGRWIDAFGLHCAVLRAEKR